MGTGRGTNESVLEVADEAARRHAGTARDLLAELVAQPSVEADPAIESCLNLVADQLAGAAIEIVRPVKDGLTSLVLRFGRGTPARRIAFAGHVDVVPVYDSWTMPPFALTERDGLLYGRGTCDMKGGVAAFVAALIALDDANLLHDCALELILTGDEEVGSRRGMISLLERGLATARRAVCGEPTGLDVFLGNRGLLWATVTVHGRGGHAGQLPYLHDPVPPSAALIEALARLPLDAVDERFDPPCASLAVTRIDAGAAVRALNIVPDSVEIGLDRRLLPGEDVEAAVAAVRDVAAAVIRPPFRYDLELVRSCPPYAIRPDDEIAVIARESVLAVQRRGAFGMDSAANDSSWLDWHGIATVLLGPGAPELAHVSDEHVTAEELADAVRIYARVGARTHAGLSTAPER
ncbi:MAG: M20/M25/M40 family metallo-hydrolase [Solirubrobacterales bacterium]|nr:M20/M25/M40 family metallo-hydrolase [Solirubrobacterales bacterium]